jgi:hypothetical protein
MNIPDPTPVFDTYWRFAGERHAIYLKRVAGDPQPWTNDPILQQHKFTNAFRACDRVSQYLIRDVIYKPEALSDPEEVVFRILLFKFFNRISTWETLNGAFGIPAWQDFDEPAYVSVLDDAIAKGKKVFSAAYMHNDLQNYAHVTVGRPKGFIKHPRYLRLLKEMMEDDVTGKLQAAKTYRDAFNVLGKYALHEDFIGMQHLTDINYSEVIDFDEDDFILPGPGALQGIEKCFAYGREPTVLEAVEVIEACVAEQDDFFQYFGFQPVRLQGKRRLHLIDCQNLFCECDKYARVKYPGVLTTAEAKKAAEAARANKTFTPRIKQTLKPTGPLPAPFFPPKWGI